MNRLNLTAKGRAQIRADHHGRRQAIDAAIDHLQIARDWLALAGTAKATDKVRRALKSAEGARRHARLAHIRAARQVKP